MTPKSKTDLDNMRAGGKLLATILANLAAKVTPGIAPKDLSADAAEQIKKHQMKAVVLGYDGFPDVMCISVNEAIVHGIPGNQPIRQGVGYEIHESPNIPNFGVAGTGPVLHTGMTLAIEPMACLGDWHISLAKDKATIIMKDGSLGAHFEHTVLITDDGAEILTSV
jgi:methionine aminopeptidase